MADKIRDEEDRILESVFAAEPLMDNGFSDGVLRRMRKRLWLRRITLPVAAIIGGAIAFEPLVALVASAKQLSSLIPQEFLSVGDVTLPQIPIMVLGVMLFAAVALGTRVLDE